MPKKTATTKEEKRYFWLFWSGQFVSSIGDHMFYAVLIFLVLTVEVSHSGTKAGIVSFLETLPFLLFGPFVGALVDRFPKRYVMIGSDIARIIVLLLFWPFYWVGQLRWWSIGTLAFLHTTFSAFFLPARDTFLPFIAKRWIFRANALLQSSTQLAMVTGAFLAGIFVGSKASPSKMLVVLTMDAATFLASVFTIWKVKVIEPKAESRSLFQETLLGLSYVKRDPFLLKLLILTALDNLFIMGPAIVGANLLVKKVFDLGPSQLAFFQASMATGWLIGTLWLYWKEPGSPWKILVWGIFFDGATYLPFLFLREYTLGLIAILVHGFFIPWITVSRTTLVQKYVKGEYMGRVFALVHLTVLGATALSSFGTGVLGDLIAVPFVFFIPGVLGSLMGVVSFWILPDPLKVNKEKLDT